MPLICSSVNLISSWPALIEPDSGTRWRSYRGSEQQPRDRLALGAVLRGPLVGLTEEELLDITWALPRDPETPDALPRLDLNVDPDYAAHDDARDVARRLRALRQRVNATTPYDLLCQAVDHMRVRAIDIKFVAHGIAETLAGC